MNYRFQAEAEPKAHTDPYKRSRARLPLERSEEVVVVGGSSNHQLAESVAEHLGTKLAESKTQRFADGETFVRVYDNVNGKHVYIV